jgi:hypothetical protein
LYGGLTAGVLPIGLSILSIDFFCRRDRWVRSDSLYHSAPGCICFVDAADQLFG